MNQSAIEKLLFQGNELERIKLKYEKLNNQFIFELSGLTPKTRQKRNNPQNRESIIKSYTSMLKEYEIIIIELNRLSKMSMKIQFDSANLN